MKIRYLAAVLIGLAGLGLTQRADAAPLEMTYNGGTNNSSQYLLGTVLLPNTGGGQANRDRDMTNAILAMGVGAQGSGSPLFSRSFNNFGSLPAANTTGNVINGATIPEGTTPVTVSLGTGFQYLVVAYDGPNGGVAVFNVAGLTGSVDLYRYADPITTGSGIGNLVGSNVATQGFFKMTGWTLLNPTGSVPDGGTTVMLLGAGLGALAIARRFLRS